MRRHWKAFVKPCSEFDTFALACAEFGQHPGDALGVTSQIERYDLLIAAYVAVRRARYEEREGEIELLALRIQHRLDEWFSGNPCPPLRTPRSQQDNVAVQRKGRGELTIDDIPD